VNKKPCESKTGKSIEGRGNKLKRAALGPGPQKRTQNKVKTKKGDFYSVFEKEAGVGVRNRPPEQRKRHQRSKMICTSRKKRGYKRARKERIGPGHTKLIAGSTKSEGREFRDRGQLKGGARVSLQNKTSKNQFSGGPSEGPVDHQRKKAR